MTECKQDELWSFVHKKEGHLSALERILLLYGDASVWIAPASEWRLVPAFVIGKRVPKEADLLIEQFKAVSCGFMSLFTSDQLPHYPNAEIAVQTPGQRGQKPKPKLLPPLTDFMPKWSNVPTETLGRSHKESRFRLSGNYPGLSDRFHRQPDD